MSDPIVCSKEDACVRHSDLLSLEPGGWLTDAIINHYFACHCHQTIGHQFISPSVVSLLLSIVPAISESGFIKDLAAPLLHTLAAGTNTSNCCWIPLNDAAGFHDDAQQQRIAGTHWVLLLALRGEQTVDYLYFDSISINSGVHGSGYTSLRQLASRLVHCLNAVTACYGPARLLCVRNAMRQQNSFDCGIYCLLTVDYYLLRQTGSTSASTGGGDRKPITIIYDHGQAVALANWLPLCADQAAVFQQQRDAAEMRQRLKDSIMFP